MLWECCTYNRLVHEICIERSWSNKFLETSWKKRTTFRNDVVFQVYMKLGGGKVPDCWLKKTATTRAHTNGNSSYTGQLNCWL